MSSRIQDTAAAALWAVRLPVEGEAALGKLRLLPGVTVLVDQEAIWLRGDVLDDRIEVCLRSLPDAERFHVRDDDQLTSIGETVPRAVLPVGKWQSLATWLPVELPVAAFAGSRIDSVALTLVRSEEFIDANVLQTTWTSWRDYALAAPQIRLNQWSFAASDGDAVIVRGSPPPSLPGKLFAERSNVAIPVGWRTEPRIEWELIRQLLPLAAHSFAIFDPSGDVEILSESAFVKATRSAVRLTDKSLGHLAARE